MGDSYSMKIPIDLAEFFQKYIDDHKELGYRFVSQYVLHILQDHAKVLLNKSNVSIEKKETNIKLNSGTYSKEELQKILANMEE